jgi:hypothetical protein
MGRNGHGTNGDTSLAFAPDRLSKFMKLLSQDNWSPKWNVGTLSTLMTFSDELLKSDATD